MMPHRIDPETRRQIDAKLAELGEAVRCPPDLRLDPNAIPSPAESRALAMRPRRKRGRQPDPAVQARVEAVARRLGQGEAPEDIGAALGLTDSQLAYAVRLARQRDPNLAVPRKARPRSGRAERRARVLEALRAGKTRPAIAAEEGVSYYTIHQDVAALLEEHPDLVVPKAPRGKRPMPRAERIAAARQDRKPVAGRRNGRRFMDAVVPTGEPNRVLPADHPAMREGRPLFPEMVVRAGETDRVLKSGKHNRKIGERVLVGRLKGAPILTLTLPERATCPPCGNRADCYMNSLQWSKRIAPGADLEAALLDEVFALAEHFPGGFLVRLHIGGDFYSLDYVRHWRRLLRDFPPLNVFGFTSWDPSSEIGAALIEMRQDFAPRFEMRFSGWTGHYGCFQIDFPTHLKRLGDAVVCPEMRDSYMAPERSTHCGSCGLCWSGRATPIVFILH